MKTKLLTRFIICFLSFCLPISVTACPPPSCPDCYTGSACDVYICGCFPSSIGFSVWPSTNNRYVCIVDTVTFSAWPYTWDGDGCSLIYSWDFGRDAYDPCTGAGNWASCRYSSIGDRTVTLTVTRVTIPNSCCSTPRTASFSRTVTVVKVASLEPDPGPCIEEIDDSDGNPDTKSFVACAENGGVITVRATPNPVVSEQNLPGYGYTWGWQLTGGTGSSWLIRTVDRTTPGVTTIICVCGSSSFKQTKIYVVKVDKVVEAGTTNEGPLYPGCLGTIVFLEAKPSPAGVSFPSGGPYWEIVEQPTGANASLSPTSGSTTTTLSGLTKWGNYVVKAKCGCSDTGDSITVKFNLVSETQY